MRYINLMKNIKNWYLYLFYKIGLIKAETLLFKARRDILIEVPQRLLHTFKEIFMEECYMHAFPHKLSSFPLFIDIGANAGYFSLFAVSRFANTKILAYEPISSNFEQLRRNINLNKGCNISAFQMAVAGYSGKAVMAYDDANKLTTSARMISENFPTHENNVIEIQCVTIKDIFDENKLDICDFLKMDCEGAENEIIFNCPLEYLLRIKQFAIEVHGDVILLKEYLHNCGFITYETKRARGMLYAWKV